MIRGQIVHWLILWNAFLTETQVQKKMFKNAVAENEEPLCSCSLNLIKSFFWGFLFQKSLQKMTKMVIKKTHPFQNPKGNIRKNTKKDTRWVKKLFHSEYCQSRLWQTTAHGYLVLWGGRGVERRNLTSAVFFVEHKFLISYY